MLLREKKIHSPSCLAIPLAIELAEMMGVYIEANLGRVIIMWGLGRKENYTEGVASLLCLYGQTSDTQSGGNGEQGDFNPPPKVGFLTPCW